MLVLVNEDIACELEKATGKKTIPLPAYSKVSKSISKHADTLACVIENTLFVYADYLKENKQLFEKIYGYRIVGVERLCKNEYPHDVGLNILIVGKKMFCNTKYTSLQVIEFAKKNGYEIIDIKQGYAGCTTVAIGENAAITSDMGVYRALTSEGIDSLYVSSNDIYLEGYNTGFFGGSVCFLDNTLYIFGDLQNHRDYDKILAFLGQKNIALKCILPGGVSDFGGIRLLK